MPDPSAPRAPLEVIDPDHYERHGPPHAAWARLRREAPLAWCEGVQGMPPFWAVTRHADLVRFSRDPARFQNAPLVAIFPAEQLTPDEPLLRHLLGMDPPDHRDYRNLLAKHFTPRAIEAKRAAVAAQVDAILDAAMERGEIDFVTDVAAVMPIAVIAEMMGLPTEDRPQFFRWTNETIAPTDPEFQQGKTTRETSVGAIRAQLEYFARMVERRRRRGSDDFIGLLAKATLRGEPLPEFELLSYLVLLVIAGNETTRNAASGGLLALLQNPGERDKLQRNPSLVRPAVEEIVRWVSPVNQFCRTPTQDFELHGVRVRAREPLCLFYGSANRDESVFEDPFAFRVDRAPNAHVGFGIGEHVCLGAHLARLELEILFAKLFERLESIELAGPVQRLNSSFISGIKHLPVRLALRPARAA